MLLPAGAVSGHHRLLAVAIAIAVVDIDGIVRVRHGAVTGATPAVARERKIAGGGRLKVARIGIHIHIHIRIRIRIGVGVLGHLAHVLGGRTADNVQRGQAAAVFLGPDGHHGLIRMVAVARKAEGMLREIGVFGVHHSATATGIGFGLW